jgi:hypothetical protein
MFNKYEQVCPTRPHIHVAKVPSTLFGKFEVNLKNKVSSYLIMYPKHTEA